MLIVIAAGLIEDSLNSQSTPIIFRIIPKGIGKKILFGASCLAVAWESGAKLYVPSIFLSFMIRSISDFRSSSCRNCTAHGFFANFPNNGALASRETTPPFLWYSGPIAVHILRITSFMSFLLLKLL